MSIGYGVRLEKYIRQFSVGEIFNLFRITHPDFPFQLTTFRKHVPKNLVAASLRDVKRNTCPLHENVKRSVSALNRFFIKTKAKERVVSSTIDLCLEGICKPFDSNSTENRNPLHWKSQCTKGKCAKCGFKNWFEKLKAAIEMKELHKKTICYSQWISEWEGKKTKVILVKKMCNIMEFLNDVLLKSISTFTYQFPEVLRLRAEKHC